MLNFVLSTNGESFAMFFRMPAVWVAMIICILGIALVMLARRIVRVSKKTNDILDNDRMLVTLKCIGILMIFVALLIVIFININ